MQINSVLSSCLLWGGGGGGGGKPGKYELADFCYS